MSSPEESREERAREALEILRRERFAAFVRAAGARGSCIAVRIMNRELDEGKTVDDMFFTGVHYGFSLAVSHVGRLPDGHRPRLEAAFVDVYDVKFGCQVGPMTGDGGTWRIEFSSEGAVENLFPCGAWIS